MPHTPVLEKQMLSAYLSGYADGESSFCVSFSPRKKLKAKIEIRPSFSVSQNKDRIEVLKIYQNYFQCGFLRPDRSDKTFKYEVRSLNDLLTRVIPHFEQYPLLSSKNKDFQKFAQICKMLENQKVEVLRIINLAFQMNTSGKRKYDKNYLISLL